MYSTLATGDFDSFFGQSLAWSLLGSSLRYPRQSSSARRSGRHGSPWNPVTVSIPTNGGWVAQYPALSSTPSFWYCRYRCCGEPGSSLSGSSSSHAYSYVVIGKTQRETSFEESPLTTLLVLSLYPSDVSWLSLRLVVNWTRI